MSDYILDLGLCKKSAIDLLGTSIVPINNGRYQKDFDIAVSECNQAWYSRLTNIRAWKHRKLKRNARRISYVMPVGFNINEIPAGAVIKLKKNMKGELK